MVIERSHTHRLVSPGSIYDLPRFPEFFAAAIGTEPVGTDWTKACEELVEGSVLEIGGGTGRLSRVAPVYASEYCIIEKNKWLAENLGACLGPKVRVLQGIFPEDARIGSWDCVLMHQNTFLELVNETSIVAVIDSIASTLRSGGVALLDYLVRVDIDRSGDWHTLFSGAVSGVGEVNYQYRHKRSNGETHLLELKLRVDGDDAWGGPVPFAFQAPQMDAVVSLFRAAGCRVTSCVAPSIKSFYGQEMAMMRAERS